jgi:hypothetical protein
MGIESDSADGAQPLEEQAARLDAFLDQPLTVCIAKVHVASTHEEGRGNT